MKIAILTVFWETNTENYFLRFFNSVEKLRSIKKNQLDISIYLLDNSKHPRLNKYLRNNKITINKINVIESNITGFAPANNFLADLAWQAEKYNYFLFLNPDTEIDENALEEMLKQMTSENNVFCVDAHQYPLEHPKWYDPITGNTSWCSGACLLVRSKEFMEWKGFRNDFIIYAEDVDLSWRAWEHNYICKHSETARCVHHFYGPSKNQLFRQYWNIRNGILMRKIHGTNTDLLVYIKYLIVTVYNLLCRLHINEARNIFKAMSNGLYKAIFVSKIDEDNRKIRPMYAQFINNEYAYHREL